LIGPVNDYHKVYCYFSVCVLISVINVIGGLLYGWLRICSKWSSSESVDFAIA